MQPAEETESPPGTAPETEYHVIQRYIEAPLLIAGRKFDMRLYALCVSYKPLRVYLYRSGFARFAHELFRPAETANLAGHLTNVAV